MKRTKRLPLLAVLLAVLCAGLLAGCAPSPSATASPAPTVAASPGTTTSVVKIVSGATNLQVDQTTGAYTYQRQCSYCGLIVTETFTGSAAEDYTYVCPRCGRTQRVQITYEAVVN
jgi:type IV pilus biogenesis protein CpaD/CtpE